MRQVSADDRIVRIRLGAAIRQAALTDPGSIQRVYRIISCIIRRHPPPASVAEFGCGNGLVAAALAEQGYDVLAIDCDSAAVNFARQKWGYLQRITWQLGDVAECHHLVRAIEGRTAVVCADVLEHLLCPRGLLHRLHKLLSVGSWILITLPNGRGPWERQQKLQRILREKRLFRCVLDRLKKSLNYDGDSQQSVADNLEHLHFFSAAQLKGMLLRAGWTVTDWQPAGFLAAVFPISAVRRWAPQSIERLDAQLSARLPRSWSSEWLVTAQKTDNGKLRSGGGVEPHRPADQPVRRYEQHGQ